MRQRPSDAPPAAIGNRRVIKKEAPASEQTPASNHAFLGAILSRDEKNREGPNIVTPKKGRPLNLGLIGRHKRVFRARAGRETPAHKPPHLSARRGVLAMWPLA